MTYDGGSTILADDVAHTVIIQMDPVANSARAWFDYAGGSAQPASGSADSSTSLGATSFDNVQIRGAGGTPAAVLAVDDLRLAGSWDALRGVTYTITASAGADGTVTPVGATVVTSGNNQTYTITPAGGFQIATLTVVGSAVLPPAASYTFTNVTANHTIAATFTVSPPTYTVTYAGNGSTGGVVPTDGTAYVAGATVTVLGNTGSLVQTGSTFLGWNTAANGSGSTYAPAATFAMGSANVTLYAQWTTVPIPPGTNLGGGNGGCGLGSGFVMLALALAMGWRGRR